MLTLRLRYQSEAAGQLVEVALDGVGAPRTATARFNLALSAQDREDLRWYLYVPAGCLDPAGDVAAEDAAFRAEEAQAAGHQAGDVWLAAQVMPVVGVDRRGAHPDQHLIAGGHGLIQLGELQLAR